MSDENHHIIEKVAIEIDVESVEHAHAIENNIQAFIKEKVIPEIERFFEAIDRPDLHLQMDRISLNFDKNIISNPFWKTDLHKQLQKEFQEPILEMQRSSQKSLESDAFSTPNSARKDIQIRNVAKSDLQALSHFLTTGNAPWWMNTANRGMQGLLQEENLIKLFERPDVIQLIFQLFKEQSVTRKRFVFQFSNTVQLALYWKLIAPVFTPNSEVKKIMETIVKSSFFNSISTDQRHEIWFALHTLASNYSKFQSNTRKKEFIRHVIERFAPKSKKELVEIIEKIVAKKALPVSIGDLPPIFYFAVLFVVEVPSETLNPAKKQLKKVANPYFEITKFEGKTLEWHELQELQIKASRKSKEAKSDQHANLKNPETSEESKAQHSEDEIDSEKKANKKEAELDSNKSEFEEILEEDWNPKKQPKDLEEGVYLDHAGVLLMHPFFVPLFKNLELLNEKKQLTNPLRATLILHFMATGEMEGFEHEMQFAKFLCGVSSEAVMDKTMRISDAEKEEVEKVLLSALEYWKSLKSSSIPLLQHEFLKRPGKLFAERDLKRVVVEQKTVDILMNNLPWGIGMLRLPWLNDLIHVDWN